MQEAREVKELEARRLLPTPLPLLVNIPVKATGYPFGCSLAWGINDTSKAPPSFVNFVSDLIGSEPQGGLGGAYNGCQSIKRTGRRTEFRSTTRTSSRFKDTTRALAIATSTAAATSAPTERSSFETSDRPFCRSTPTTPRSHQVWPTKPLCGYLKPDFIGYTGKSQQNPLSLTELGQLAGDIICAIKSNMPTPRWPSTTRAGSAIRKEHSSSMRCRCRWSTWSTPPVSATSAAATSTWATRIIEGRRHLCVAAHAHQETDLRRYQLRRDRDGRHLVHRSARYAQRAHRRRCGCGERQPDAEQLPNELATLGPQLIDLSVSCHARRSCRTARS